MRPLLWLLCVVFCAPGVEAQSKSSSLGEQVRAIATAHHGDVALFAENLKTHETVAISPDTPVQTASVIKLAILYEALEQVRSGKAHFEDKITLTKADQVQGSGVLLFFDAPVSLTLKDVLTMMIVISDNTATNLVLDVLTTDAVNARMESLGFKQIKINRKVMSGGDSQAGKDPENKKYGLGFATPHEMVLVMEKLERGEIVSPAVSKEMIELMKREQARYAIGRSLWDLPMASKYGALDRLRSAIGIIYSKKGKDGDGDFPRRHARSCGQSDNPAYVLMSQLSEVLVNGLVKLVAYP
jgi:beta-lactamase class A